MPRIIMYWDETDVSDNLAADIRIEGYGLHNDIEVPENACGFRLRKPGNSWDNYWYFGVAGNKGEVVEFEGTTYDSTDIHNLGIEYPEYIEATGPVRHCAEISPNTGPVPGPNPTYHFQLPLAQIVGAIDPFVAVAGSFIAEFFGEDEIEWLDAAAEAIEFPEFPEPEEPEVEANAEKKEIK